MRIRMLRTRDWTPPGDRRVTFRYQLGGEYTVRRCWGVALVAAGDAEEIPAPVRLSDEPGSREQAARPKTRGHRRAS